MSFYWKPLQPDLQLPIQDIKDNRDTNSCSQFVPSVITFWNKCTDYRVANRRNRKKNYRVTDNHI